MTIIEIEVIIKVILDSQERNKGITKDLKDGFEKGAWVERKNTPFFLGIFRFLY